MILLLFTSIDESTVAVAGGTGRFLNKTRLFNDFLSSFSGHSLSAVLLSKLMSSRVVAILSVVKFVSLGSVTPVEISVDVKIVGVVTDSSEKDGSGDCVVSLLDPDGSMTRVILLSISLNTRIFVIFSSSSLFPINSDLDCFKSSELSAAIRMILLSVGLLFLEITEELVASVVDGLLLLRELNLDVNVSSVEPA